MADRKVDIELTGDARDLQRALSDATKAVEDFGVRAIRSVFANMLTFERLTEALADALPRLGRAAIAAGQSVTRGFRNIQEAGEAVIRVMDRLHGAINLLRDVFQFIANSPFVTLLKTGLEQTAQLLPQIAEGFVAVWRNLAVVLTSEIAPKIQEALLKILKAFYDLTTSQPFIDQLKLGFTAIGNIAEWAGNNIGRFVEWLTSNANAQAVKEFLSSMLALLKTIGDTLFRTIFPAFQKAFDPKNIQKLFPVILVGIKSIIDGVFGLGRVWNELGVILRGLFNDLGDYIRDMMEDATLAMRGFFAETNVGFHTLATTIIATMLGVANAIQTALPWLNINTSGLRQAAFDEASALAGARTEQFGIGEEGRAIATRRQEREARKDREDPYRRDPIGKRIADAFFGRGDADLGPQRRFWDAFNANNKAIQDFLFGPGVPQAPAIAPPIMGPVGGLGNRVNPTPPMLPWWNRPGPAPMGTPPIAIPPMFNLDWPQTPATGSYGTARPADRPWWWGGAAAPPPEGGGARSVTIIFQPGMTRAQILAQIRSTVDRELFDEFPGAPER